jgi:hypothetical protein
VVHFRLPVLEYTPPEQRSRPTGRSPHEHDRKRVELMPAKWTLTGVLFVMNSKLECPEAENHGRRVRGLARDGAVRVVPDRLMVCTVRVKITGPHTI